MQLMHPGGGGVEAGLLDHDARAGRQLERMPEIDGPALRRLHSGPDPSGRPILRREKPGLEHHRLAPIRRRAVHAPDPHPNLVRFTRAQVGTGPRDQDRVTALLPAASESVDFDLVAGLIPGIDIGRDGPRQPGPALTDPQSTITVILDPEVDRGYRHVRDPPPCSCHIDLSLTAPVGHCGRLVLRQPPTSLGLASSSETLHFVFDRTSRLGISCRSELEARNP